MSADLVTFLRARLDEDEARLSGAWGERWHEAKCGHDQAEFGTDCVCDVPACVLADVAAKRAIVEAAEDAFRAREDRMTGTEIRQNEGERYAFTLALRNMAAVYADHPDCDGAVKP